jgi:hypothetical protein
MSKSPIPRRNAAMTKIETKPAIAAVNELFAKSPDGLREIVSAVMQAMLEVEMTDALGAGKGERTSARLGYRSGYYTRTLVTRVGKLELRVPQDRDGRFSTELFERYQRSEQALVATLAEMYVQGVSTRKVKAITEELCGHAFSASAVSAINKRLDESLDAFARRPLAEPFPYLILDARYEKVREGGVVVSQAVLIAIGIDWDGRRQILAVDMANRESGSSWKSFLLGLRRRGLDGVEFVVADDHAGLRAAIREVLPEAAVQRCYTSSATPSIICRARPTTTACRSCAGSMTGAMSRRPAAILPPGPPNGVIVIKSSSSGPRKRSRRPSPSIACRASTISISRVQICSNGSTKSSNAGPTLCASFPMPRHACASSEP